MRGAAEEQALGYRVLSNPVIDRTRSCGLIPMLVRANWICGSGRSSDPEVGVLPRQVDKTVFQTSAVAGSTWHCSSPVTRCRQSPRSEAPKKMIS